MLNIRRVQYSHFFSTAKGLVIYGTSFCRPCIKVKQYLSDKSVPFQYINTESEQNNKILQQLKVKYNWKTTPMIFLKGNFVGGYSDLVKKVDNKEIILQEL